MLNRVLAWFDSRYKPVALAENTEPPSGVTKFTFYFIKQFKAAFGLRMVLVVAKRLKGEGGRLVLSGMQPHVREVFDISGFLAILNVEPTRAEALARF